MELNFGTQHGPVAFTFLVSCNYCDLSFIRPKLLILSDSSVFFQNQKQNHGLTVRIRDRLSVGGSESDWQRIWPGWYQHICWESFDESKRMSAEATEDFQMLYEDLQIKYHTERLIIVQKVQIKLFFLNSTRFKLTKSKKENILWKSKTSKIKTKNSVRKIVYCNPN